MLIFASTNHNAMTHLRIILLALMFNLSFTAAAQPRELWQLRTDHIARWAYDWGDEFDGGALDKEKWRQSYPWGRNLGNNMLQYYSNDNSFIEDGRIILEAREQDTTARGISWKPADFIMEDGTPNLQDFKYTSGMIYSNEQFFQGYFETRLKLANGAGFFPGFWLFGGNPNEEVDILESKGERPDQYHIDMHCPSGCSDYRRFLWWRTKGFGGWIETGQDLTTSFHDYAGEWTLGEIVFYMDGMEMEQWAGKLEHPANVILNLGIKGGTESTGGFNGPVTEATPFPSTVEAEFIRRYVRIDEGWKEKEKAELKRSGRKKKKRVKRIQDRVDKTVRVFVEANVIRVEDAGGTADCLFVILDRSGSKVAELEQTETGWSSALPEESQGEFQVMGTMNGMSASMTFTLSP